MLARTRRSQDDREPPLTADLRRTARHADQHVAAIAPDGSRIYISDEALSTLDVVDGKTLKVVKQIPLSGHPNNLAIGRSGKRVYVGIIQAPGGVEELEILEVRYKSLDTA